MAKKKKFVDVAGAGDRTAYREVLEKIQKDGVCPFCPKNFIYHTRPILRTSKNWIVTENMNPYKGTKHHLLFVHKKHIESIGRVTPQAWKELLVHIAWAEKKFKIKGGTFFIRSGDTAFTGASVQHLHAQFMSGGRVKKTQDPILVVAGHKK